MGIITIIGGSKMAQKTKQYKVKEIMQENIFTAHPNQTIFDASVLMAVQDIGTLPVVKEDGTLVGILTDRDIVTRCTATNKDIYKTNVFECMTPNPVRTVSSAPIQDAMGLMAELGTRRLPVIEQDKLVGIISLADIANVSTFCPNEKHPDETCILIDVAKEHKNHLI